MNYTILEEDCSKRLFRVELRVSPSQDNPELFFYQEQPLYTSRLCSIQVHDAKGNEVQYSRIRNYGWRIHCPKDKLICISYLLHCFVMSPEECYISEETWVINPKSLCLLITGWELNSPSLNISSANWNMIYSGMGFEHGIDGLTATFATFDHLFQYPMLLGKDIVTKKIDQCSIVVKGEIVEPMITQIVEPLLSCMKDNIPLSTLIMYIVPKNYTTFEI
jgi:predicted metalloprotease with PDZ domain